MDGNDAVRLEVKRVEVKGLAGQEMRGNGVAAEGIEHQQVKSLGRLPLEGEPRIPQHHFGLAPAPRQAGEAGVGNALHLRVDLVKAEAVAGPGIARQRADAQSDRADAALPGRQGAHRPADAALLAVIQRRAPRLPGVNELPAVPDAPVHKAKDVFPRIVDALIKDPEHAVEVARGRDDRGVSLAAEPQQAAKHNDPQGDPDTGVGLPAARGHAVRRAGGRTAAGRADQQEQQAAPDQPPVQFVVAGEKERRGHRHEQPVGVGDGQPAVIRRRGPRGPGDPVRARHHPVSRAGVCHRH